jgi:hypothetical protein
VARLFLAREKVCEGFDDGLAKGQEHNQIEGQESGWKERREESKRSLTRSGLLCECPSHHQ